jgi:hypothetical protein
VDDQRAARSGAADRHGPTQRVTEIDARIARLEDLWGRERVGVLARSPAGVERREAHSISRRDGEHRRQIP